MTAPAPYTIDDFTRDLAIAVANDLAARRRFADALIPLIARARRAGLPLDASMPLAVAAIEELSESTLKYIAEKVTDLLTGVTAG